MSEHWATTSTRRLPRHALRARWQDPGTALTRRQRQPGPIPGQPGRSPPGAPLNRDVAPYNQPQLVGAWRLDGQHRQNLVSEAMRRRNSTEEKGSMPRRGVEPPRPCGHRPSTCRVCLFRHRGTARYYTATDSVVNCLRAEHAGTGIGQGGDLHVRNHLVQYDATIHPRRRHGAPQMTVHPVGGLADEDCA